MRTLRNVWIALLVLMLLIPAGCIDESDVDEDNSPDDDSQSDVVKYWRSTYRVSVQSNTSDNFTIIVPLPREINNPEPILMDNLSIESGDCVYEIVDMENGPGLSIMANSSFELASYNYSFFPFSSEVVRFDQLSMRNVTNSPPHTYYNIYYEGDSNVTLSIFAEMVFIGAPANSLEININGEICNGRNQIEGDVLITTC